MKYFTIPKVVTLIGQREIPMQTKAVPLTDVELPRDTLSMKWFGTFPTQLEINTAQEDDPEWKKKCIIEIDQSLQQIDLTPFIVSLLGIKVGSSPTTYLEDLDIKLTISYYDSAEIVIKYMEVPPGVATNYYWEIYTVNKVIGQRYITCYFLRSKHYDTTKGVEFYLPGGTAPITPLGQDWRITVSVKKTMNRSLNFNTLLSTMVSRSVMNPLIPGNDPVTNRPNNPTFCPVTGEAVYKFIMSGLTIPTVALDKEIVVGGDQVQPPAEKVEIRTETTVIRSNTTSFYSNREYLQFKVNSNGSFLYHNTTFKKIPWRVLPNGETAPGGDGTNTAADIIYERRELKAIKDALPEVSFKSKNPEGLITPTGVDFSKENVDYPAEEIWENQPAVDATLRTSQTGRLKVAPYLVGNPVGDTFEKYDNYGQRLSRQKYKAFFEDDDLIPKKIVEYMIKDIIADKIAIGYSNGENILQPLSDLKESYSSINTSPDPVVLQSYAQAVLDAHKTATILDHPDSSVTASKLAENAVETSKIADRVITAVKIALGSITLDELAQSAIEALTNIPDDSITHSKLAANSVDETNIVDGSVLTEKIANGAITADKLAASINYIGTLTVPTPALP